MRKLIKVILILVIVFLIVVLAMKLDTNRHIVKLFDKSVNNITNTITSNPSK